MKKQSERKVRYYYPYCGHRLGFCLSNYGCQAEDKDKCIFYFSKHPYTGHKPKMVTGIA